MIRTRPHIAVLICALFLGDHFHPIITPLQAALFTLSAIPVTRFAMNFRGRLVGLALGAAFAPRTGVAMKGRRVFRIALLVAGLALAAWLAPVVILVVGAGLRP